VEKWIEISLVLHLMNDRSLRIPVIAQSTRARPSGDVSTASRACATQWALPGSSYLSLALARRRLLRLPPDAVLSTLLIVEALREIWITNQRCARLQTINQAIKKTNGRRIGDANPNQRVSRLPWWISGKFPTGATCVA
jgi:hypothetical protein